MAVAPQCTALPPPPTGTRSQAGPLLAFFMGWAGEREKASQHKRAMNTEPRNPISLGGQALPCGQIVTEPGCALVSAARGSGAAEGARGAGGAAADGVESAIFACDDHQVKGPGQ